MLVVAALGGNALLRRGQPADAGTQRANITVAVRALAALAREHDVVVAHGNGPQVGLLALQGEVGHGTAGARALHDVDAADLRGLSFAAGSMGPKVDAACRFAEATGGLAGIGALSDASAILRGERGTRVRAGVRA